MIEKVDRDWDPEAQLRNLADKLDEIVDWINKFEIRIIQLERIINTLKYKEQL